MSFRIPNNFNPLLVGGAPLNQPPVVMGRIVIHPAWSSVRFDHPIGHGEHLQIHHRPEAAARNLAKRGQFVLRRCVLAETKPMLRTMVINGRIITAKEMKGKTYGRKR